MTPIDGARRRNQAESRTAFALHRTAAMRLAVVCLALAVPVAARAQTMAGSCTGMVAGSVGLSVPDGKGGFATIQAAAVASVFGNAECACSPPDATSQISFELKLTTALPIGTTGSAEVWVGSGCDQYMNRQNGTLQVCEKIASPNIQNFTTAGSANNAIEIPIPGNAIVSPIKHDCSAMTNPTGSNGVYLLMFNDPTNPFASCKLQINEQNQGPQGVTGLGASSGDGAVTVNWTDPPQGSYNPTYYQVLCADDCGNPVNSSASSQPTYSTCINGVLARRQLNTGGNPPTTGDDGGTTSSPDLAPRLAPPPLGNNEQPVPSPRPNASPFSCAADMGSSSMGDMGAFAGGSLGPLATLDPKYICSGQLTATATKTRVTGLNNYQTYHFVVLSIDQFGNATASAIVDGTPQPTEDLWRRYRDEGGGPGGCVVGTGALDTYERWVWALFAATMLAAWLLRRRKRT
jgi:hypothetical protein